MSGTGTSSRPPNLNKQNLPLVVLMLVLCAALIMPDESLSLLDKLSLDTIIKKYPLPLGTFIIAAMICQHIMPNSMKHAITYWRISDPLPGCRAFSKYAEMDHRINVEKLQRLTGPCPRSPREQNTKWYELYQQVENHPAVISSNKSHLLFRDLSVASFLSSVIATILMTSSIIKNPHPWISIFMIVAIYIITSICAQNASIKFVQTVMAVISSKKQKAQNNSRKKKKNKQTITHNNPHANL